MRQQATREAGERGLTEELAAGLQSTAFVRWTDEEVLEQHDKLHRIFALFIYSLTFSLGKGFRGISVGLCLRRMKQICFQPAAQQEFPAQFHAKPVQTYIVPF